MTEVTAWFLHQFIIGDWRIFVYSIIQAIFLIILGIIIGKVINFLLFKAIEKFRLESAVKPSFLRLLLIIIRWSIYILFVNIALEQLNIPELTRVAGNILLAIPAVVGALILISIGFIISSYLKDMVEETKMLNWEILSKTLFYFVMYIFLIFALKTALLSVDTNIVNILIIILTTIIGSALAYTMIKKKR